MSSRLTVRVLPPERFDEAEPIWRALESAIGTVPTARSWTWASCWVRHYGDLLPTSVAVVESRDGRPEGIVLLPRGRRRHGPIAIRSLWLGTANLPVGAEVCAELAGPLARSGQERAVVDALLAHARAQRGWDELRAEGLAERDAALLCAAWDGRRARITREASPFCDLSAIEPDGDVASALPSSGARRRARSSLRAMERRGPLHATWATDPAAAVEIFEELIVLHQRRWVADGEPGVFGHPRFAAFHRDLLPRLVEEGRAALFRASVGDETIGCLYHHLDGDRLLFYQSGLASFEDNRLRSGIVTHLLSMEQARRHGLRLYDFLAGDARYKRDLSNGSDTSVKVALRRRRARLAAYDVARGLRDRRSAPASAPSDGRAA